MQIGPHIHKSVSSSSERMLIGTRGCKEKASPLYIGRRLSNARRSAQILPEDVQPIVEHKLDFSNQQNHRGKKF